MKTIAQALDGMPCSDDGHLLERLESWMREVQLDAFKAGMTRSAEACKGHADWMPADNEECADYIISERDRLKSNDIYS